MSKVVLFYQFVVIVCTNSHPIPTLFCVTIRSIHLWTFSEIPEFSTFPIHLWNFLRNPNISTLPLITTFVEISGKTENFHYSNMFSCPVRPLDQQQEQSIDNQSDRLITMIINMLS